MDECEISDDFCVSNAMCSNEVNGFSCECNDGYSGNGTVCAGMSICVKF